MGGLKGLFEMTAVMCKKKIELQNLQNEKITDTFETLLQVFVRMRRRLGNDYQKLLAGSSSISVFYTWLRGFTDGA